MTLRERLEWLTRMTLLVFILASAAFLSAITAMRIAIHGREVTMPNLVGKNVSEANNMLRSRGLVLRVADRIYSEQPVNVVLRQTPPAGLLMKVSQQAHVVLSLGQRQLQMRRKVNYVSAPQWPRGAVIDQSPMAGSKIPSTATIELTVAN